MTHPCLGRSWQVNGYLKRLMRYGEEKGFDELPVRNAVCLAEGSLPLIVALEEPFASAGWFHYDRVG